MAIKDLKVAVSAATCEYIFHTLTFKIVHLIRHSTTGPVQSMCETDKLGLLEKTCSQERGV